MRTLYCYRSGELFSGLNVPDGSFIIGTWSDVMIARAMEELARIRTNSSGCSVFMVPGLTEDASDDEAIRIAKGFRFQVSEFAANPPEWKIPSSEVRRWSPELLARINAA